MRTLLRMLAIGAAAFGALLAVLLLYLAFGDLGTHKGRIERYVSRHAGRPFAIDGPFALDLFPAINLKAQRIRIGNAAWGSRPQFAQVGHFSAEVDLWSVISGPVIVRTLELRDVTVILERNAKGENNWTFGEQDAAPTPEARSGGGFRKLPIAFLDARLENLQLTYRVAGQDDRRASIESLTVLPGSAGLLAISGKGALDDYPASVSGEAGPLASLVAMRDIRMAIDASLGNMHADVKGVIGSLDPLDGADLKLTIENPDVGTMLRKLRVPVVANGPLHVQAALADSGKRTRIDLQARAGDLHADVSGSLAELGFRDSELDIKAQALDAARLAAVLGIERVPARSLDVAAHVFITPTKRKPAGRAVRGTIKASLGGLQVDAKGSIARLHPLELTELTLTVDDADAGALLRDLQAPPVADGPIHLEGSLATEGKRKDARKRFRLEGTAGDITASVNGTIAAGQRDPEVEFKAQVQDAARLAGAFDIKGVPSQTLQLAGHMAVSPTQLKLTGVSAILGGAQVTLDGAIARAGERTATTRFDFSTDNLAHLGHGLPAISAQVSGDLLGTSGQFEFSNLSAVLGKTRLAGTMKIARTPEHHIDADLSSPLLDFSLLQRSPAAESEAGKPAPGQGKKDFRLSGEPLALDKLRGLDARLRLRADELRRNKLVLKEVDTTITVQNSQVKALARASGGYSGDLEGELALARVSPGHSEWKMRLELKDLRAGIAGDEGVRPEEVPPTTLSLDLRSRGDSPRELASAIDGTVYYALGHGKIRRGALGRIGGDVISQLFSRLNPFAKEDPHTELDCAIARMDIKGGKAVMDPVLMQTRKVTVTAKGTVDLDTEALELNFNTRPRSGIGISPGMFTNPFLELRGTLLHPTVRVGAKGVTSGALAAASAGATVIAKGVVDRVKGEVDLCKKTLEDERHRG